MNLEEQLDNLKKEYEEKLAKYNEALAKANNEVERIKIDTEKIAIQKVFPIMHRNNLFNQCRYLISMTFYERKFKEQQILSMLHRKSVVHLINVVSMTL